MTSTALAPAAVRVAEIQARFSPAPRIDSNGPNAQRSSGSINTSTFSSVLSSLMGATAADIEGSPAIDLSALSTLIAESASQRTSSALTTTGSARPLAGSAETKTGSGPTPSGSDVVAAAKQYLGVDYVWGGTDPSKGLDCSGLVQRVYRDLGVQLPRVSYDQAKVGTKVDAIEQARPGDLVAFGSPVDHIAIYVGDGKIIQAPRSGDVVRISDISRPIAAIRRVLPNSASAVETVPATTYIGTGATGPDSSTGIPGAAPYENLFQQAGAKYGLNPRLLAAVAKTESNFDPAARSGVGAIGLMQFMPATAKGLGIDPTDPAQAVDGGARYLKAQLDRFGSVDLALAAYNAGPGAVQRAGGIPPYTETRNYVTKVLGLLGGQAPTIAPTSASADRPQMNENGTPS